MMMQSQPIEVQYDQTILTGSGYSDSRHHLNYQTDNPKQLDNKLIKVKYQSSIGH